MRKANVTREKGSKAPRNNGSVFSSIAMSDTASPTPEPRDDKQNEETSSQHSLATITKANRLCWVVFPHSEIGFHEQRQAVQQRSGMWPSEVF